MLYKRLRWSIAAVMLLVTLPLSTCRDPVVIALPGESNVVERVADCEAVVAGQIAAWDTRDPERVREIYTDDIVHFDDEPAFVGIDRVVGMSAMMFRAMSAWEMAPGDTYIAADRCAGQWLTWGSFGFPEDDPGVEFDVLETRGDKISFWRLYYDQAFRERWQEPDLIDQALLDRFAATWSTGDVAEIRRLYASGAVLTDSMMGVTAKGPRQIATYVGFLLDLSPTATWVKVHPFCEGPADPPHDQDYPFPGHGSTFDIQIEGSNGEPCTLQSLVILAQNERERIVSHEVFWRADTLLACGWVD